MKRLRPLLRYWPHAWLALWGLGALSRLGAEGEFELARTLGAPSRSHPFGLDAFGRDLLELALQGSALSAGFASGAVFASCILGIALGSALALAPQAVRFSLLRVLDLLLAFPSLILALALAAVWGPGWSTLIAALAIGTLPSFIRLVYVRSRELLQEEYVLAARSLGATPSRIATRHLTPALLSLCSVKVPGLFAHALMAEATLSFLGVGAPIGRDTWGSLLAQAKDYLIEAPHLAWGAGIPLILTVLSLQVMSERWSKKHLRLAR